MSVSESADMCAFSELFCWTFIAKERWKQIAFYEMIVFTLSSRLPHQALILSLGAPTGQLERIAVSVYRLFLSSPVLYMVS